MNPPPTWAFDEFWKYNILAPNERACWKTYKSKISVQSERALNSYKDSNGHESGWFRSKYQFFHVHGILSIAPQHCQLSFTAISQKIEIFFSLSNCIYGTCLKAS